MCRFDKQINLPIEGVFMAVNFRAIFAQFPIAQCSSKFSPPQTDSPSTCPANPSAKAESHPIAERVSRFRGCASTQALQPGGVNAKVMGGSQGTNGRGQLRGCASTRFSVPRGDAAKLGGSVRGPIRGGQVPQPRGKIRALRSSSTKRVRSVVGPKITFPTLLPHNLP
jgi:hypothetical protein